MSYSSEVRVDSVGGLSQQVDVSLILWELFTTIDNANRVRHVAVDNEQISVSVSGGTKTPFSFVRGPDFLANNNHTISLAAYQSGSPGPMFRSGRLDSLPAGAPGNPAALVDVMLVEQQRFTMADINAMIHTPMTLPDGNTVTTATVTSAPPSRTLTLVATGPYGAATYTYTLTFTIDPSDDQYDLTRVLHATAIGRGSIVFTAGPGGGLQAFIDNLFAGLFVGSITNNVIATITTQLNNAAAVAGAAAAAAAGAPGGLPAGVVLGVRRVAVSQNGDLVMTPAIGCFGSLIDRFVAASPPRTTPSTCFIATAAHGADSIEVSTLRTFRDQCLLESNLGRSLVALYERLSPPIAVLIAKSPALRAITRKLIIFPAYKIANRSLTRCSTGRFSRRAGE